MQTLPPCGLGGAPTSDGECVGVSGSPSDAGGGVFSGISATHAATAIVAAGAVLVGLLFAVWAARKVAAFFRSSLPDAFAGEAPDYEWFGSRVVPDVGDVPFLPRSTVGGLPSYGRGDSDAEWDTEDDSPDDNPDDEPGQRRLEYGK